MIRINKCLPTIHGRRWPTKRCQNTLALMGQYHRDNQYEIAWPATSEHLLKDIQFSFIEKPKFTKEMHQ